MPDHELQKTAAAIAVAFDAPCGRRCLVWVAGFCGVEAYEHYRRSRFSNCVVKDVDLSGELYGEVFEPLKSLEYFKQFRVDEETRTVTWPNGVDIAPEYLYTIGHEVLPSAENVAV